MTGIIEYGIGITFAILAGIVNNFGLILQKRVVNSISEDQKFGKQLVKSPLWIFGLGMELVFGSIFFFISELLIGPVLPPGLMATGLIVLALGSSRLNKERLKRSEWLGMCLMILAIFLLAFTGMSVGSEIISSLLLTDLAFLPRVIIFTIILVIIALSCHVLSIKSKRFRGMALAVFSGLMFAISNFWVGIFTAVLTILLTPIGIIMFITCCIVLIMTNYLGIFKIQQAFQHGQASNLIPVQQVSIQVMPIPYFTVIILLNMVLLINFITNPYTPISILLLVSGIALIIAGSFLLGRIQAKMEKEAEKK
ncbi:MAG: hypothetical protein ACTSRW_06885 [Candidatus Helarchaeota archaeon]